MIRSRLILPETMTFFGFSTPLIVADWYLETRDQSETELFNQHF